jgi:RNA polymerase sigma-70 factor (ECF subfamily)
MENGTHTDGTKTAKKRLQRQFAAELAQQHAALRQRALRLTKNVPDAEDLVQETIVRAMRAACQFKTGSNFTAWAGQIMRNTFIDRCRENMRMQALSVLDIERLPANDAKMPTLPDLIPVGAIDVAIDELGPLHRQIVRLAYRERLNHRDIAKQLKIPVSTAGVRLWRARRRLRTALEREWGWMVPAETAKARLRQ